MNSVKNRSSKINLLPSVAIGGAVSVLICLLAALVCPIFVLNGALDGISINRSANILQGIAVFSGVLISGMITADKKWLIAIACTGSILLLWIACAILFFEINWGASVAGLLCSTVGMVCALFMLSRNKKSSKNKKLKRRSR